jgi:serine/threonine-protein kinase RsbW
MATVVYAEVDLLNSELAYACAGHLPPLLHEPAGSPQYLLQARSAPLGSRAGDRRRTEHRERLAAGSRLLLYTDGLVERRGRPIDRGFEVLAREYARRRDAPLKGLTAGLADTLVGRDHGDDVCLLCLTLGTEERLERSIGADPLQISLLRADLRGWLRHRSTEELPKRCCWPARGGGERHRARLPDDPFGVVDVSPR